MYSIKNSIWVFLLMLFAFNNYAQVDDLDQMIEQAILLSPKIKMLEAKRNAAYSRIDQNSNLPDPVLILGLRNIPTNSFSFDQDPMTQKAIGLSQMFPFPGKLSAIEEATAIDTLIIDQEINDTENGIRQMVTKQYYNLNYFRRAIFYAEESKKLLRDIADVVSVKYSVSTASQQNLVKVQLELTRIDEKIAEIVSKEKSTLSELNAFLLRDAKTDIKTELIGEIKTVNLNAQELNALARSNRPLLKGIRLSEDRAGLKLKVAEREFYPDISLGVNYSFRQNLVNSTMGGTDLFTIALGISLPLNYGGKYTAKEQEAISLQEFHSEQYSSALQFLDGRFGSAIADLESLEERIKLFEEGLLPQAAQNLNSTLAGYQVNEVDFINVIDAQDLLFKIETNLYKLKTDYLKLIADLEFLVGTSLQ
ncbi:MAG: TolC family protein [Bacteroidetes bacterium]|nr:TolC family protein [Bacteroidota bacterium]MCH8034225.1 TolC family protein [Bacteroidota bacterium]